MCISLHLSSTIAFSPGSKTVPVLQERPRQHIKRLCLKTLVQVWKQLRRVLDSRSITQTTCLSLLLVLILRAAKEKDLPLETTSKEVKTMLLALSKHKQMPMLRCQNPVRIWCSLKSPHHNSVVQLMEQVDHQATPKVAKSTFPRVIILHSSSSFSSWMF